MNGTDASPTVLELYLEELGRYPLLSAREEREAARSARSGGRIALDRRVQANLRFVISVAKRYRNRGLSFLDLVQEGNVGLVVAARKFDPDQGVKFISYAVWWIRQAILAALAQQARSVRLPLNRATELARVVRVRGELRQSLDREPRDDEIADGAGLAGPTVEMLRRLNTAAVRLDSRVGASEDSALGDRFLADETNLEEVVEARLLKRQIAESLRQLRPRDARVVRLYYGLQGEDPHTLEQIGRLLGVTRERVRQLRDRALRELRDGPDGKILAGYAT
ncbi:sigma-70 family RNA polymerase sigma factor [Candidatus Palauibacter sp.]|uniref:sigma-70 family RNA polymerase sigma factor n=1 Tax=Candidatus Palauibacter sp. TaxID=3101350 RepID=UPI003B5A2A00